MLSLFSNKIQKMVGLDISSSTVKLLELGKKGDSYCIESYAVEPLPPEAMNETEIKDVEAVGQAIANVVKRSRTSTKLGAIAIQGSSVITKIIQMNASLKEHELVTQISLEADRYIPYPLQEVNLDFQVLGPNAKNAGLVDILLVGTKTENVDSRIEALMLGGLTAKVVDVEAYAIERAFELIKGHLPDSGKDKTVAIIDIGATTTILSVLHDGKTVYTREQIFGGKQLTEEIQHRYKLPLEEATIAKKEGGLPDDYEAEVLNPFKFIIVQQISRSLQFFFSSGAFTEIDYIVLAGGTAMIPGLTQLIEQQLGVPTIVANPFSKMLIAPRVSVSGINADAPALLICCGLAMRSFINGH